MARAYSEWRAPASGCGGALVWLHRDLRPGAGWGLTASDGTPKSPYWYLKRAWAPVTVRVTDEGLDGLAIHVINEAGEALEALVEIEMLLDGKPTGERGASPVRIEPRGAVTLSGDGLVGHFTDATNAYRFGPPKHDVVAVRLRDAASGAVIAEDFHFPLGHSLPRLAGVRVEAEARWDHAGSAIVTLSADAFLQAVAVDCPGFMPGDNYFHLAPGQPRSIAFAPLQSRRGAFEARFQPLNTRGSFSARVERDPSDSPDETR
jgi:beta-mannosidase